MAYGQIGMIQASAGFFIYFLWESKTVNDLED